MVELHTTRRGLLSTLGVAGIGTLTVGTSPAAAAGPTRHVVGTSTAAATKAAARAAASVHRVLDFGDIGNAVAGRFSDQALDALTRNPDVRYVEADGQMHAVGTHVDGETRTASIDAGDAEVPWGIDRVDAEKVHADGATGGGADVAILDTGIDSDHPDLAGNLGVGRAYVSASSSYAENWDDDNGHGTHCAGIADAIADGSGVVGVSTQATLHAVKVLDDGGSGYYSDVAAGLEWVADQGYDVANMSFGGPTSSTIEDVCRYAADRGVLLVAAAGNDGTNVEDTAPATYSTVVAVSATDRYDDFASFSNYGSDVELAAPGVDIYSTYVGGGYDSLSGTSMAAPHVAGAGGQLMAQGYSHTDARKRLGNTAEDIGLSSSLQGAGLLDVEAAVSGSTDAAPTVSWLNPTDGATVSGSVGVEIDASDAEDSLDGLTVEYRVDGGTWQSTTLSSGGTFTATWDSTAVADGDHALEARATDTAGNASTSAISVTTDNTERTPSVDSLSASEVETSDGDAEFDASWQVSDADGDLSSVDLVLTQESDGTTEDSATVDVSGDAASGTTRLVAAGDDGTGNGYTVEATVTDGAGGTDSATASATETEATNAAPTVDSYVVTEAGSPNPHAEITADWAVGDTDGNLATVVVEVVGHDSHTSSVSGSNASGTDQFQIKHARGASFDVKLTVTDGAGETASTTRTVSE